MFNSSEQSKNYQRIIDKKADILYLQAPISNGTILVIVSIYAVLLQNYLEPGVILTWSIIMAFIALVRLFLWHQRKKNPAKLSPTYWIKLYIIGTGFTGLAWSSILLLPYSGHDLALNSALIMLLFGITASAVSILSISLAAFYSYTLPLIIGFIITLDKLIDDNYLLFVLAIGIYYLMLSLFARNTNQQLINSITLQLHNQTLIKQLQKEGEQRESIVEARTEQLVQSNQAMVASEHRLQNVINGANLGYWDWNYQTGHYEVNNRWLQMLGLTREDIKNDVSDWNTLIHPDDRERLIAIVEDAITKHKPYVADFRMQHKDGHWVWIQGAGSLIESDDITHEPLRLCGTHQDISYRKQMEKELEYRAQHDHLTGLYNRTELEKHFQEELTRAKRYQHSLAIFMIDIDHFKQINDTHGHQSGDQILKKFAIFLQETIRTTDNVARYGGEEFVVILPETSAKEAEELAERLRVKTAELSIELKDCSLTITISIGIAAYPEHGQSYAEIIEVADSAMYQAKQNGRNCVRSAGC